MEPRHYCSPPAGQAEDMQLLQVILETSLQMLYFPIITRLRRSLTDRAQLDL